MNKKPRTMYDELMQDSEFKEEFDKSYRKLILSELILAILKWKNESGEEITHWMPLPKPPNHKSLN